MRNLSLGFPTRSKTNQVLQPHKKFRKNRDCTIYEAKTKALIGCAVTGCRSVPFFCICKMQVFS